MRVDGVLLLASGYELREAIEYGNWKLFLISIALACVASKMAQRASRR
jgi:hypothetical protein